MGLIFVTDLDGTLLDHATYRYDAAAPALAALRTRGIPLVLATSKTAAEVAPLHAALALGDTPAIVENGAGIFTGAALDDDSAYRQIRAALAALPPDLRAPFRGFGDMTAEEVAQTTGLSPEAASLAKTRLFSEPGLWAGSTERRADFEAALAATGIHARQGGRFLTLSQGRTKADALLEVASALGATTTVALGDAPNDIEMLQAADHGVIIRNDHGAQIPTLPGEATGRITRTEASGPSGWNRAVLALLSKLDRD